MTLDGWNNLDARLATLEAKGAHRTPVEQDQYVYLLDARARKWSRLEREWRRARAKLAAIEAYARQHRLPLDGEPA